MEKRVQIVQGDITEQRVDAIVNAADIALLGGSGVDGAIHRAAGPELLEETRRIGGCPIGEARVSKGYRLPAKYVIHTVGPIWLGGNKDEKNQLARCYRSCFKSARDLGIKTIAFPAISTGNYSFPFALATEIAMTETKKFLDTDENISSVVFVCFEEKAYNVYKEVYRRVFVE